MLLYWLLVDFLKTYSLPSSTHYSSLYYCKSIIKQTTGGSHKIFPFINEKSLTIAVAEANWSTKEKHHQQQIIASVELIHMMDHLLYLIFNQVFIVYLYDVYHNSQILYINNKRFAYSHQYDNKYGFLAATKQTAVY